MTLLDSSVPSAPQRLLDRVRERVRELHDSLRKEQACVHGVRAFVRFHGLRHPKPMRHAKPMGQAEVAAFQSWLSVERRVPVSTQRQALPALLLLWQQVLGQVVAWTDGTGHPRRHHPAYSLNVITL